jgi:hypothetical protein
VICSQLRAISQQMETCPGIITCEWAYGGDLPFARLACPQEDVQRLAAHLASAAHMKGSSCGTAGRGTGEPVLAVEVHSLAATTGRRRNPQQLT